MVCDPFAIKDLLGPLVKLGWTLSIDGHNASAFISCLGGCNVIRWKMSLFAGNAHYGFFALTCCFLAEVGGFSVGGACVGIFK